MLYSLINHRLKNRIKTPTTRSFVADLGDCFGGTVSSPCVFSSLFGAASLDLVSVEGFPFFGCGGGGVCKADEWLAIRGDKTGAKFLLYEKTKLHCRHLSFCP